MERSYYIKLRNRYLHSDLHVIFVAESPPASGKYFYDEDGSAAEPLFKALMNVLDIKPATKKEGLATFSEAGHILVDATYTPVNKIQGRSRKSAILADYGNLSNDLKTLCGKKKPDVILIKANICRLLEQKLRSDGFNVKNGGVIVRFPVSGQQKNFLREMKKIYRNPQKLAQ